MLKSYPSILMLLCLLAGCSKLKSRPNDAGSPASVSTSAAGSSSLSEDVVHNRVVELAGTGATNCGIYKSSVPAELNAGSKCAEDAFKARSPFFIEYEMPGLTVAVAGNAKGQFYSVQSATNGAGLTSGECPAELRVASSGRVTCYAQVASPMGAGSRGNPHGTVGAMPPGHPTSQ
jgi:hypothetical protein